MKKSYFLFIMMVLIILCGCSKKTDVENNESGNAYIISETANPSHSESEEIDQLQEEMTSLEGDLSLGRGLMEETQEKMNQLEAEMEVNFEIMKNLMNEVEQLKLVED